MKRLVAVIAALANVGEEIGQDLVDRREAGVIERQVHTMSGLLEDLLGRRVDLVTTEALSPYIGPHILAEAADVLRPA